MAAPLAHIVSAYGTLGKLIARLNPSRLEVAGALCLLLLTAALEACSVGMLVPLLSSLTGDASGDPVSSWLEALVPGLERGQAVTLCAALTLSLIAAKNLVSYAATLLCTRLRREGTIRMRGLLVERVLHGSFDALEKRTTGELMNVFLTEAARTSLALDYLIQLSQRSIVALGYLTAILFISFQLTICTLIFGLGLGLFGLLLSRRLLRQGERLGAANTALARRLTEISGGLRLIRTTHGEQREAARFDSENRAQAGADVAVARSSALLGSGVETLGVAIAMAMTALAYHFFLARNELTAPEFLAFGFGLLRLLPAVNQIHGLQVLLVALSAAIRPTLELIDLPGRAGKPFGREPLKTVQRGIEFVGVTFAYPGGAEVLRNLSFSVPAGSFLAVVGASGAGKTTLASLLLRLRQPSAGTIRIDGRDHWDFEPESYCAAIGYVEQDPFLFNASIAENVLYGANHATPAELESVLSMVGLGEFMARLPGGVDSVLPERGSSLSGGQRQRLAIARALIQKPQILVLDEPTSALDADTEREVVEAIERARAGRTLIVIAHRLTTIARADAVLNLDDGRLTHPASGTPRVVGA